MVPDKAGSQAPQWCTGPGQLVGYWGTATGVQWKRDADPRASLQAPGPTPCLRDLMDPPAPWCVGFLPLWLQVTRLGLALLKWPLVALSCFETVSIISAARSDSWGGPN